MTSVHSKHVKHGVNSGVQSRKQQPVTVLAPISSNTDNVPIISCIRSAEPLKGRCFDLSKHMCLGRPGFESTLGHTCVSFSFSLSPPFPVQIFSSSVNKGSKSSKDILKNTDAAQPVLIAVINQKFSELTVSLRWFAPFSSENSWGERVQTSEA